MLVVANYLALAAVVAGMSFVAYHVFPFVAELFQGRAPQSVHLRGRRLLHLQGSECVAEEDPAVLRFGGLPIPFGQETEGFLFAGSPGSGKTVLTRAFIKRTFIANRDNDDARWLFWDLKLDLTAWVTWTASQVLPGVKMRLCNPFDARCAAWDMAADLTTFEACLEAASGFVPHEKENTPYFSNAARHLFAGAFYLCHIRSPGEWTLKQAVELLKRPNKLRAALSQSPATSHLVETYFESQSFSDVASTIATKIAPFESVAEYWERSSEKLSVRDWKTSRSILVLTAHDEYNEALQAVNRAFLNRLGAALLTMEDSTTRRTFVVLDEFAQGGQVEMIRKLLARGRSKGTCTVLTAQDKPLINDVYGQQAADHIVSQVGHQCFLRQNGHESATWASATVGEEEVLQPQHGQSTAADGSISRSISWVQTSKRVVLASELASLPTVRDAGGVCGFYLAPHVPGVWSYILPIDEFPERVPQEYRRDHPDFAPQPPLPTPPFDPNQATQEKPRKRLEFKRSQ